MVQDKTPGIEEQLNKGLTAGYIGFDPSTDSLHIGNLATIMLLKNFQLAGHKPIALVGGATGMIGDPAGKSEERALLNEETIRYNEERQKKQLSKFLDFGNIENSAEMVNNYDWMKDYNFLDFIRDIGKHISVSYMIAKDSVKSRLGTGLSFTEFSYQLVQAYDFYYLYKNKNCKLQMGGSDQWGNIVTGTELIRRKAGGEAFALTCPLVTKADGSKFGKTETGNIWLDPDLTSPYKFYQFWLNVSDKDAERYIKIFTILPVKEIEEVIIEHLKMPHARILQKTLAKEITIMVHSEEEYNSAVDASQILFGKGTTESLRKFDEDTLLDVFEGVPQFEVKKNDVITGINIVDLLTSYAAIFPSKGELRRMIKGGGLSINKEKINQPEVTVSSKHLINGKYILVQKGKKNYYLIKVIG